MVKTYEDGKYRPESRVVGDISTTLSRPLLGHSQVTLLSKGCPDTSAMGLEEHHGALSSHSHTWRSYIFLLRLH